MSENKENEDAPLMLEKFSMEEYDRIPSAIPEELMAKLTVEERYLFNTVSKTKEQNRCLAQNAARQNEAIRTLIRTTSATRDWRMIFSSKWGMVIWGASIIISVLIMAFVKGIVAELMKKTP